MCCVGDADKLCRSLAWDLWVGKMGGERVGYTVYRCVMGLLNCSTNTEAAKDLKAKGSTDETLFFLGMTHELVNMIDILGMAEGIADISEATAKAVYTSYKDYAIHSSNIAAKLLKNQPVSQEDILYLFITPDKQLFFQGIESAKKIGGQLKEEYLGNDELGAYKKGRLTVLVVPIILTGGQYLIAKGPQMLGRMSIFLTATKSAIGNFGAKIAVATKRGWTIVKEATAVTFSKEGKVIKFFKRGERWESDIPRTNADPEFAEFIDADWNTVGSGAAPFIPKWSLRTLDEILDAAIVKKVKDIRQSLTSDYKRSGNIATAKTEIQGLTKTEYFAHNRIDALNPSLAEKVPDISLKPTNTPFSVTSELTSDGRIVFRDIDSEFKILSEINIRLGNNTNATGNIKLFTELAPCNSCQNVFGEFTQRFPNIKIEVIHNSGERLINF